MPQHLSGTAALCHEFVVLKPNPFPEKTAFAVAFYLRRRRAANRANAYKERVAGVGSGMSCEWMAAISVFVRTFVKT